MAWSVPKAVGYEVHLAQSEDAFYAYVRDVFGFTGLTPSLCAELAGLPDYAYVTINCGYDPEAMSSGVTIKVDVPDYNSHRILTIGDSGATIYDFDSGCFNYEKEERTTGKGLGVLVFARQVQAAVNLGVEEIYCYAERNPDLNGYYTWPRLGFDAELPTGLRTKLAISDGPKWLRDLMTSSEGRAWWRKHGCTILARFCVREGSYSMKQLESYLREKGLA